MPTGLILGKGARAATALGLLAAAFLSAWLFAYWFWKITTRPSFPPPVTQETSPAQLAASLRARHVFGEHDGALAAGSQPVAAANMVLTGIVSSGGGKPGVAVIAVAGGKPAAVREGDEVAPGAKLLRVAHDRVEISQQGRKVELALPVKK